MKIEDSGKEDELTLEIFLWIIYSSERERSPWLLIIKDLLDKISTTKEFFSTLSLPFIFKLSPTLKIWLAFVVILYVLSESSISEIEFTRYCGEILNNQLLEIKSSVSIPKVLIRDWYPLFK